MAATTNQMSRLPVCKKSKSAPHSLDDGARDDDDVALVTKQPAAHMSRTGRLFSLADAKVLVAITRDHYGDCVADIKLPGGAASWSAHVDESGALLLSHMVRTDDSKEQLHSAKVTHAIELHKQRLQLKALKDDVAKVVAAMNDARVSDRCW